MEMTGGRGRERKETKSFKREGTENQQEEAAGAGPLIITDTLIILAETCAWTYPCVLVWNDRSVRGMVSRKQTGESQLAPARRSMMVM